MLNKVYGKQTLVAIVLAAAPAGADPPHARAARFADWRIDCASACAGVTTVAGADGSELLRLTVSGGEGPMLVVTTPLPLHLPDGLALALGGRAERAVPWRTCGPSGCEATVAIDPALLEALRRERAGTVAFTLVQGERVRLPVSLMGFSAALRALEAGVSRP